VRRREQELHQAGQGRLPIHRDRAESKCRWRGREEKGFVANYLQQKMGRGVDRGGEGRIALGCSCKWFAGSAAPGRAVFEGWLMQLSCKWEKARAASGEALEFAVAGAGGQALGFGFAGEQQYCARG